jgi:hypothetical protein
MAMAKRALSALGTALLVFCASSAAAQGGRPLPLKRVRLYETGVGYFERSGTFGSAGADLPVPAGHLDDALKTLVVSSDDPGAAVAGVEFGSSVSPSLARALAGLPGDEPLKLHSLLRGLKGAEVVVKTRNASLTGRLVELVEESESDLERCVRAAGAKVEKAEPAESVMKTQSTLVLLAKDGTLERLPTDELVSVKATDPSFAARLGSAVDALSGRSARVLKELRVRAKSGKSISLSYVAETPVWRTTYRLVLADAKQNGTLQGWALIHNDTEESWSGVQVELVNGEPDSFLFPLAAPRYARRALVAPAEQLATVPQLMETTADGLWSAEVGDGYGSGGLGLSGIGEGGGGRGVGIGHGRLSASFASADRDGPSSSLSIGNLAAIARAEGVESGALFRYTLKSPVDLASRGSALVPFVSDTVAAQRIASFTSAGIPARSAVYLVHRGNQTLPAGTIAVFADGGFAGEALLERMKPKESTVVEFGFDRDVELVELERRAQHESRLVRFANRRLYEHYVRHSLTKYEIENRSGSGRSVFLKLSVVNNARVTGADELHYDSKAGAALAVFRVAGREKKIRDLRAEEGLSSVYLFKNLTSQSLARIGAGRSIPANQKQILAEARERLLEAEARRGGIKRRGGELSATKQEISRLREHVRALGAAGSDAAEPIVERLLAAEDRARQLELRLATLEREAHAKSLAAASTLERLGR